MLVVVAGALAAVLAVVVAQAVGVLARAVIVLPLQALLILGAAGAALARAMVKALLLEVVVRGLSLFATPTFMGQPLRLLVRQQ